MKKNVAGQTISAVVVSATDGSAITSGVSVTVNGDGGTQAAGSGTVTHEGGGEWSYAPTQGETNFDHIMFKFSGTGAIPVGVQVYTTYPQTGDSFDRLGAPAGASVSADIATVDANVDAILDDTGTSGVVVNSINLDALDATALAADAVAEVADGVWDEAKAGHVAAGSFGEEVQAHSLSSEVSAVETKVDAVQAKTDSLTFTQAGHVDANIQRINDVLITGSGTLGSEWGP